MLDVPTASWMFWLFLIGLPIYLYAFYQSNHVHRLPLPLLLAPDVLLDSWVAADWSRFGPLDHLPVVMGAAVILFVSLLTGVLILSALRLDRILDRLETAVFATAVGLNVWSLFTLAVGLAGGLHQRWVFGVAAMIVIAAAALRAKVSWTNRQQVVPQEERAGLLPYRGTPATDVPVASDSLLRPFHKGTWLGRLAIWFCIPFAVLIVWGGTLPPTHFDVREYHLQVPKEWFLQGRVTFLPHNVYGNMPLGAEMHAILGMVLAPGRDSWWWGALVGKTVIATFAPLTALGVYAAGRRLFSATGGAVAAFVLISTPWMAHVSMNGLIDGASACYLLLAVYAALLRLWRRPAVDGASADDCSPLSVAEDSALVALSGFLAGAGVACKYPAVLFVVAPLLVLIAVIPRGRLHFRAVVIFAVAVLVGCGLWLGKNWVLTGNPTYPLLYKWFDGRSWNAEQDARWTHAHGPPHGGGAASYSPAQLWDSIKLMGVRSDYLSPALWPLVLAGCLARGARPQRILLLLLIVWITSVWWLLTHRVDRFLVPLLPLAALLAGLSTVWLRSMRMQYLLGALLTWSCAANFVLIATPLVSDSRYLVSLRDLRTDVPREVDQSFTRIHHAHRYLNEHVGPGYTALLVGEAQVFDLEVPILYNTCFDDCIFEQLMRGRSRDERLAVLRKHRISHLFVFWRELDRYRSPGNYGYSDYPTRELVRDELMQQQKLISRVPLNLDPENGEVFEVVGWREWK